MSTPTMPEPSSSPVVLQEINLYYYPGPRIAVSGKLKSRTARVMLLHLETYLNGLITEWNRLAQSTNESFRLSIEGADLGSDPDAQARNFRLKNLAELDVHFYLICWDKIDKFFRAFSRAQGDAEIVAAYRGVEELLRKAALARNFLEHLDRRILIGGFRPRTRSMGGGGSFRFGYEETSNKGKV
jgi:hypothetical protein